MEQLYLQIAVSLLIIAVAMSFVGAMLDTALGYCTFWADVVDAGLYTMAASITMFAGYGLYQLWN